MSSPFPPPDIDEVNSYTKLRNEILAGGASDTPGTGCTSRADAPPEISARTKSPS